MIEAGNRVLLTITETGMLLYWLFAGLVAFGLISVEPESMYPDHTNPAVVAWNWSFLPIDVLFALSGLASSIGKINGLSGVDFLTDTAD